MKSAFTILSVFFLFTQCTENESENIILPKLISASVSSFDNDFPYYHVEFTGKFNEGQDPVKDIRIAGSKNISNDPRSFSLGKSVQLLDSHTFSGEFEIEFFSPYYIAFYFISENAATYSEIYSFSFVDNKPVFKQVFPEKR